MLLKSGRAAIHLPLLFIAMSAGSVVWVVLLLSAGLSMELVVMTVFALVIVALTIGQIRWITTADGEVVATKLLGRECMSLERATLGVRVTHGSKGHPSYTIYLHDGERELELAVAASEQGSVRQRAQLSSLLFPNGEQGRAAEAGRAVVAQREQSCR